MDSITQAALGAVVGRAAVSRAGGFPLLAGAVVGSVPDLDVVAGWFTSELSALIDHRSATHSLLVAPLASLALAHWLRRWRLSRREWFRLLFWVWVSHILIDWCTTFGTQLFWPLSRHPYALSIVFIVDPLYTLPLLAGVAWLWRRRDGPPRRGAVVGLLAVTTVYLAMGGAVKLWAHQSLLASLQERGVVVDRMLTFNAPFTTLQWQAIARTSEGDWLGWVSALHPRRAPDWRFLPAETGAARVGATMSGNADYQNLQRFSKGFLRLERLGERWIATDLRFGGYFVFGLADVGPDGALAPVEAIIPEERASPSYYDSDSLGEALRLWWSRF